VGNEKLPSTEINKSFPSVLWFLLPSNVKFVLAKLVSVPAGLLKAYEAVTAYDEDTNPVNPLPSPVKLPVYDPVIPPVTSNEPVTCPFPRD
jgi:hypothetical protein